MSGYFRGAAQSIAAQVSSALSGLAASAGSSLVGFLQAGANAVGRTVQAKLRERSVSVADFAGCDPTGATASDAAFVAALTYVAGLASVAPEGVSTNRLGNVKITIPAGVYLLTQAGSFLNSALFAARTGGLAFEAEGPSGSVVIVYDPSIAGPLMSDNDRVLFVRVKGIQFHGKSAASNLIDSASTGGAQDFVWEDCQFTGTWQYGANLTGTNVNSEWKFERCSFAGTWAAFLYSAAAGTSDQFLNYWFHHCKYWCSSPWIDMSKGGSIRLGDCDVSGYAPAGAQSYLFNLRGNGHARGVTSFHARGVRFEQGSQYAGIVYCEWEQGNVTFQGCDFGSQAYQGYAAGVLSAHFSLVGAIAGAAVKFDGCQIMGQHKHTAPGGGPLAQARVTYDDCDFINYAYPEDALILADSGQPGRRATVRMRHCRGSSTTGVYADAEVGWTKTSGGTVHRKLVSLKSVWASLPSAGDGTITVVLPLDAVITRAIIDVPAGAVTSTSATAGYTLQTSDGVNLATLALNPFNAGGTIDNAKFVRCTTRARATVQLIPNGGNDQAAAGGAVALVEYIG